MADYSYIKDRVKASERAKEVDERAKYYGFCRTFEEYKPSLMKDFIKDCKTTVENNVEQIYKIGVKESYRRAKFNRYGTQLGLQRIGLIHPSYILYTTVIYRKKNSMGVELTCAYGTHISPTLYPGTEIMDTYINHDEDKLSCSVQFPSKGHLEQFIGEANVILKPSDMQIYLHRDTMLAVEANLGTL